jgi:hypothetical protein
MYGTILKWIGISFLFIILLGSPLIIGGPIFLILLLNEIRKFFRDLSHNERFYKKNAYRTKYFNAAQVTGKKSVDPIHSPSRTFNYALNRKMERYG